jgi:hypothetical protein
VWRLWSLGILAACGRLSFDPLAASDGSVDPVPHDAIADAVPSDLIAYFPLDGTLIDRAGGPAGTCTAGQCPVAEVAGHLGAGMRFDGADDCVAIADVGQLGAAQLTIAIWANETGPLQARESQVSKRVDIGTNVLNSWQLETTATPNQQAFTSSHGGAGNDQITANAAIDSDVWQHIVATYDGFNERLYVDGMLVSSAGNSSPLAFDTHPAMLGCDDNAGTSELYQGVLDELRIYNRALSQAEIQALP